MVDEADKEGSPKKRSMRLTGDLPENRKYYDLFSKLCFWSGVKEFSILDSRFEFSWPS